MKILILTIFLIFLYSCNANQQQQSLHPQHGQQQLHQRGPGQQHPQQIRQCSCVQQKQCFDEWKNDITKCSEKCARTNKMIALKQVVRDQAKFNPCMQTSAHMVEQFFDCFNNEIVNSQRCTSNQQGPMLPYQNINQVISANIEPMSEDLQAYLRSLVKGQQPYANAFLDVGECGRECFLNSIKRSRCFERINCGLNTSGNFLEQAEKKCLSNLNFQQNIVKVCECVTKAGANELGIYCQTLRSTKFPTPV